MSSLAQMGLIDLTLILILASNSKGQSWNVSVPKNIPATLGSNVTIQCTFTVPEKHYTESVQVYWKKPEISNFKTFDHDQNAFVFHPNDTFVLEKFRGKTKLIGNKSQGNCSLKIYDIMENVPNIYLRVIAKGENYSFKSNFVSISVAGLPPIQSPDVTLLTTLQTPTIFSTVGATQETVPQRPVAIYAPVVAVLIIIFVVGIVLVVKHRRSKSCTRKDSGYYANFSRANDLKREVSQKNLENIKLSGGKNIEDPVYINFEAPPDQMAQSTDHTDHVYGNVDYSK